MHMVYVQDFLKMQSDMMFIVLFFNTIDHKVITEQIAVANIQMSKQNLIRI